MFKKEELNFLLILIVLFLISFIYLLFKHFYLQCLFFRINKKSARILINIFSKYQHNYACVQQYNVLCL